MKAFSFILGFIIKATSLLGYFIGSLVDFFLVAFFREDFELRKTIRQFFAQQPTITQTNTATPTEPDADPYL